MKPILLLVFLGLSVALAAYAVFSFQPRKMILGWLGVGLSQSFFLLVVGFEFLALLNLFLVLASASILLLYSALFGTAALIESERKRERRDWIYGIGTGATLAAILAFGFLNTGADVPLAPDLETPVFAREVLTGFPELPWAIGFVLFLGVVVWASIGRPGWKRVPGGAE